MMVFKVVPLVTIAIALQTQGVGFADESVSPAAAVAQESVAALKKGDVSEFVAHLNTDDTQSFSELVIDLMESATKSESAQAKDIVKELGEPAELKQKKPAEIVTAFIEAGTRHIPNYEQLLAEAKLHIIGELPNGEDRVVIVYRLMLPAAQSFLVEKQDGTWRLRLDPTYREMATSMRQALQVGPEQALRNSLAKELKSITVIGIVAETDELKHVVCKSVVSTTDEEANQSESGKVMVLPIPKEDDAWAMLDDDDRSNLESTILERLQARWEMQKALIKRQLEMLKQQQDEPAEKTKEKTDQENQLPPPGIKKASISSIK